MSILKRLHPRFHVDAAEPGASRSDILQLARFSPRKVPDDYASLVAEATEVEVRVDSAGHVRIWGPLGCIEMD
jgi:hypothetical protein